MLLTYREIADIIDCDPTTVRRWVERYNIERVKIEGQRGHGGVQYKIPFRTFINRLIHERVLPFRNTEQ